MVLGDLKGKAGWIPKIGVIGEPGLEGVNDNGRRLCNDTAMQIYCHKLSFELSTSIIFSSLKSQHHSFQIR